MGIVGTAQGNQIILDEPLPFPTGTRVRVDVSPMVSPRKGSPAALMRLVGTLNDAEADSIMTAAQECRRIDASLWDDGR